jgi:TPP-dependent pyruvate/acetoin dehydrogenase alpha subunit
MTVVTNQPAGGEIGPGTDAARLLHLYKQMVAIRLFEERVNDLYTRALMPGRRLRGADA